MKTDSEIQKDVIDELRWEPLLVASEIGVGARDGVVTLSGYVDSYGKKFAAENAAWRVKGVKAVAEELVVRLDCDGVVPDAEVADSIVQTLKWDTSIPDESIKIKVTGGWVYLDGMVDWNYQKEAAVKAIRHLKGVTGITDLLMVKARVSATTVKDNIRKALERNADLEADKIDVEIKDNVVTLKGTTRSWEERRAVEKAVWSAPGVVTIDDRMIIDYD